MKDKCPACGYRFGWRGPPYRLPAKGSGGRRPHYYCGNCGADLLRVVPVTERVSSLVGYLALLIGSSLTLWEKATLTEVLSRELMVAIYGTSVVGIGISIVVSLTSQHFFPTRSDRAAMPVDGDRPGGRS